MLAPAKINRPQPEQEQTLWRQEICACIQANLVFWFVHLATQFLALKVLVHQPSIAPLCGDGALVASRATSVPRRR